MITKCLYRIMNTFSYTMSNIFRNIVGFYDLITPFFVEIYGSFKPVSGVKSYIWYMHILISSKKLNLDLHSSFLLCASALQISHCISDIVYCDNEVNFCGCYIYSIPNINWSQKVYPRLAELRLKASTRLVWWCKIWYIHAFWNQCCSR